MRLLRALFRSGSFVAFATVSVVFAATSPVSAEQVLYSFRGGNDGVSPSGRLVEDNAGNLIGTTEGGGGGCNGGCGTIFSLSSQNAETVLYAFQGTSDGSYPSGLVSDTSGNLYGVSEGGSNFWGNVFKFVPGGSATSLYDFTGGMDGGFPVGDLAIDTSGNLYGATSSGGDAACLDGQGCGTVFQISPSGAETTLYQFLGGNDGLQPVAGVIRDGNGNLYGTTSGGGGSNNCGSLGCGTVFKLAPDGTESILHSFQGGSDGEIPAASLILDSSGNLYGTTIYGGTSPNCSLGSLGCGTVFKLAPDGTLTILHAFQSGNDGAAPESAVTMDKSGNLYGTTYFGGGSGCRKTAHIGCGTVYKVAPDGTETVLVSFDKGGKFPHASLILKRGLLYGTTMSGGAHLDGVVFKVRK